MEVRATIKVVPTRGWSPFRVTRSSEVKLRVLKLCALAGVVFHIWGR